MDLQCSDILILGRVFQVAQTEPSKPQSLEQRVSELEKRLEAIESIQSTIEKSTGEQD
jgi:uncharacterized coiled-coil DUF342 family protein